MWREQKSEGVREGWERGAESQDFGFECFKAEMPIIQFHLNVYYYKHAF